MEECWEKDEEEVAKIDHLDVAAVPETTNGAVVRKAHVVARLVSRVCLKSKKWELDQLDKVSKKERQLQPSNAINIMAHAPQRFEKFMFVVLNDRHLIDEDVLDVFEWFRCFWMFKCI